MIRSLGYGLAIHVLAALAWAARTPVWAGTLEGTPAYRERIQWSACSQRATGGELGRDGRPPSPRSPRRRLAPCADRLRHQRTQQAVSGV